MLYLTTSSIIKFNGIYEDACPSSTKEIPLGLSRYRIPAFLVTDRRLIPWNTTYYLVKDRQYPQL